jgi:hypothetical protein
MTNQAADVRPSGVFDPATYEPRSGKTFWMAATDVSSLVARRQQPTRSSATARPHDQPPVQIRVRTHIQPVWGHCERGISDDC